MATDWMIRARWIVPVSRPPIADGMMTISNGRITAIGPASGRCAGSARDADLGDVAILPGLVNAHTHLDLGGLGNSSTVVGMTDACASAPSTARREQPFRFPSFTDWLAGVVAYRRAGDVAGWTAAIRAGIDQCLRLGTTMLGDISHSGASFELLEASPLRAVVFHELVGLTAQRAEQSRQAAEHWLAAALQAGPRSRPGLSPHAPYSVRRTVLQWALAQQWPVAIHAAETPWEEDLLERRQGPLRQFLERIGAWCGDDLPGCEEVFSLLEKFSPPCLLVHANYLPIETARRLPASVVYCPRTHAAFGHPPHPVAELLQAGVNVALGTDSLASNPNLSILEEMRFLFRTRPDLPTARILAMGTQAGAQALGFGRAAGTLEPGQPADWIAVPVPADADDPYHALLAGDAPVRETWIDGVQVYRAS